MVKKSTVSSRTRNPRAAEVAVASAAMEATVVADMAVATAAMAAAGTVVPKAATGAVDMVAATAVKVRTQLDIVTGDYSFLLAFWSHILTLLWRWLRRRWLRRWPWRRIRRWVWRSTRRSSRRWPRTWWWTRSRRWSRRRRSLLPALLNLTQLCGPGREHFFLHAKTHTFTVLRHFDAVSYLSLFRKLSNPKKFVILPLYLTPRAPYSFPKTLSEQAKSRSPKPKSLLDHNLC